MSEEFRAAAKEVAESVSIPPIEDAWGREYISVKTQDVLSAKAVACAYLAEHPADDEEAVTDEWAATTYGPHLPSGDWKRYGLVLAVKGAFMVVWLPQCGNLKPCLSINEAVVKIEPTRGDVRRLCKALGVELKGSVEAGT